MSRARFFVSGVHDRGETVRIDAGDAHHIVDVLRLRSGDRIDVVDSAARTFVAELVRDDSGLAARLVEQREPALPRGMRIDVAQALPKGSKMDAVVEKATELGAATIFPFYSARTIARSVGRSKLDRWRRITRSAAEQSGRRDVPAVVAPTTFADLVSRFCAYDAVLFAWEAADVVPLRARLPALIEKADSVLIVVGPEGGFSHEEAATARASGAEVIWLGERILRTETAALVLLAILGYASAGERSAEQARRMKTD